MLERIENDNKDIEIFSSYISNMLNITIKPHNSEIHSYILENFNYIDEKYDEYDEYL